MVKEVEFSGDSANCTMPFKATVEASGYDLSSCVDTVIQPGETKLVDTGVSVRLPSNTIGWIQGRSGLARRSLICQTGVLDADYEGSIAIILTNIGHTSFEIRRKTRVGQIVFTPLQPVRLTQVNTIKKGSVRGDGGFGSTGL